MIGVLYVGDVHFKHSQKEECEKLAEFIFESVLEHKVRYLVFLGDLNDTFGLLRTENLTFWTKWLKSLSQTVETFVLVGNHDKRNQSNDQDLENSLSVFNLIGSTWLHIVQKSSIMEPFGFLPYVHDKKRFIEESNNLAEQGAKVLICHGEFDGGAYDNGFFIKDGIKPEDLKFDLVISGHIHTRSTVGKIRYPGNPRWLNSSDANKEKGLWLVEHDSETGAILNEEFLDTSKICTPIYAYQYKEGEEAPSIPEGSRASVELVGSSEWVNKQKVKFKGLASISTKITDKAKPANRKSGNNLEHFINNVFETTKDLNKEQLIGFMRENGIL